MSASRLLSSLVLGGTLALGACGDPAASAVAPHQPIAASSPLASVDASSCTAGSYFDGTDCVPADPGFYVAGDGATEQTACAAGSYQPNPGSTACWPADAGAYVPTAGATQQLSCPVGTYQDEQGATSCKLAPVGTFAGFEGLRLPYRCPSGTTTLAPGSITMLDCVYLTFEGFSAPLDPTATNVARAGSAIPVKFSLGGDRGLYIVATGFPTSVEIPCTGGLVTAAPEETDTAGGSTLTYDPTTEEYKYVWKTEKRWSGTCRRLTLKLSDGMAQVLDFQFSK